MSENTKNWVDGVSAYLVRFWPLSLVGVILTFLGQLENFIQLSSYLSHFLKTWRVFLHGIFEVPINTALEMLGINTIDIAEPIPEILTVSILLYFSILRRKEIENSKIVEPIAKVETFFENRNILKKFFRYFRMFVFVHFTFIFIGDWLISAFLLYVLIKMSQNFFGAVLETKSVKFSTKLAVIEKEEIYNKGVDILIDKVVPIIVFFTLFIIFVSGLFDQAVTLARNFFSTMEN